MTLVETAMCMVVFAIGVLAAISVLVSSMKLDAVNRETKVAFDAARARMETVRSEAFLQVARVFNANPADDPGGNGTALGATFSVTGLPSVAAGAPPHGAVVLPVDGNGVIRENVNIPELGMPRDLNLDGVVDGGDRSADAMILPVLVRVRWNGATGARETSISLVLRP